MTTFMDTMHGLLKGEAIPVDEEGILPGVRQMMRQMGNTGWLSHKGGPLPPVVQDLIDRGYACTTAAKDGSINVWLTDKGKAYIARFGGAKARQPIATFTVGIVPPKPDESA